MSPEQHAKVLEALETLAGVAEHLLMPSDSRIEKANEALSIMRAVQVGWQPISTAPKGSGADGPSMTTHPDYVKPPMLLLFTSEGIVAGYYEWYYHEGYGRGAEPGESVWRDHDGGRTYGVTHWQPLPAPPTEHKVKP